jgi:quercetin 2,3-dioxygenase
VRTDVAQRHIDRIRGVAHRGATSQVQQKWTVVAAGDYAATSPFLMLSEDEFAAPGGFETHPHRGMQTVTFVLGGALEHRDHTGAHSVLRPGDVQWMTAGGGVLHSEMPHGEETVHTLQLWLNLPARLKMMAAHYVDQRLGDVPRRNAAGVEVRVYAGRSGEVTHKHGSVWPSTLLDLRIAAGRTFTQELPGPQRGFLYALEGSARLGVDGVAVSARQVAWFDPTSDGDIDALTIAAEEDFRALIFAAPPINEPIAFGGPFVMNTAEEIQQAYLDFFGGRFIGRD